jgi:hypothetical protein
MKARESKPGFRLPTRSLQDPHAYKARPLGGICQEQSLAHAGLTHDHENVARWWDRVDQSA